MESFNTKLSEDLASLGDPKSISSVEYEGIIQDLWEAQEEGSLCIDITNSPQRNIFNKNPPGFISEFIDGKELLFFEKTYNKKLALEKALTQRISSNEKIKTDPKKVSDILQNLEKKSFQLKKGQKEAILSVLHSAFQIISGGPGTGKTTVIAFLLQTLKELELLPRPEEIGLVAPTGRAAQRLTESIWENLRKISSFEEKEYSGELFSTLEQETESRLFRGQTIHSLLSYKPYLGGFYYNKDRYLPHKLIIVDEVSMVDMSLMLSLFQALPPFEKKSGRGKRDRNELPFRFILIGDPNQLPSVEKGAVLSDFLSVLEKKEIHISKLTESNRQKENSKGKKSRIVTLAEDILNYEENKIVIDASFPRSSEIKNETGYPSAVVWLQDKKERSKDHIPRDQILEALWKKRFLPQIERISGWNEMHRVDLKKRRIYDRFTQELGEFRCLTIFRSGYFGVEALQKKLMSFIRRDLDQIKENSDRTYQIFRKQLALQIYFTGMPILITKNDKNRKLFNGDIGLVLRIQDHRSAENKKEKNSELRAIFPIDNQLFDFALDTLPDHEPAFLMTVHKSQGSEYDSILLYLPDQNKISNDERSEKLLNRQILYTAITRAKDQVILAGDPLSWEVGIKKKFDRLTGFRI